jgi:hypothetical protein
LERPAKTLHLATTSRRANSAKSKTAGPRRRHTI